jgi:hypothetical protein
VTPLALDLLIRSRVIQLKRDALAGVYPLFSKARPNLPMKRNPAPN